MGHTTDDDLVDFACSDTWLAYYHSRGLTCRAPAPEPKVWRKAEADYLYEENDRLRRDVAALRQRSNTLYERLKEQRGAQDQRGRPSGSKGTGGINL